MKAKIDMNFLIILNKIRLELIKEGRKVILWILIGFNEIVSWVSNNSKLEGKYNPNENCFITTKSRLIK